MRSYAWADLTRNFSPAGLMIATDEQLHKLLEDLEGWKQKLPENLQFNGPDTENTAGMFPPWKASEW